MDRVAADRIPAPAPVEWVDDPSAPECFATSEGARRAIPDDWRRTRHYYFADLGHLDDQLGHVMDALEQRGRLDDTCFILVAGPRRAAARPRLHRQGRAPLRRRRAGAADHRRSRPASAAPPWIASCSTKTCSPPSWRWQVWRRRHRAPWAPTCARPRRRWPGVHCCRCAAASMPAGWRDAAYVESYNNISTATPRNWARLGAYLRLALHPLPQRHRRAALPSRRGSGRAAQPGADPAHAAVRNELRDRLLDLVIPAGLPAHRPRPVRAGRALTYVTPTACAATLPSSPGPRAAPAVASPACWGRRGQLSTARAAA